MDRQQTQDTEHTQSIPAKNMADHGTTSPASKSWIRSGDITMGNFLKGALVTGLLVISVIALFGGYMGSTGALTVNQVAVPTLEKGMGAGISAALNFLSSGMGLLTMAAGGTAVTAGLVIINQHKQAAIESELLAQEYERSRNQIIQQSKSPQKSHDHTKTAAISEDNIYKQGSVIKGENFTAAELKRRTERETQIDTRLI